MVIQQQPTSAVTSISSDKRSRPTATAVEAARRVQAMHKRVCVPEPVCRWCLRSWPCPGDRWAQQVLRRLAQSMPGGRRGRH
jgi:hypothetical protein